jgi:uncharacterized membrane protein YfcA
VSNKVIKSANIESKNSIEKNSKIYKFDKKPRLVNGKIRKRKQQYSKTIFYSLALSLVLFAIIFIIFSYYHSQGKFDKDLLIAGLIIGAIAQIVDGALGMAYGITATAFLLSNGISPAVATGSVHIAEIFTTGASGLSHWRMGNVNLKLFKALIIPGIIGGLTGVFLITSIDGDLIRPWISGYLLIVGIFIFYKAFKKTYFRSRVDSKKIFPLALVGGFVDSAGGGGWGSVVTANLLGSGHEPRKTIGSVNAAEFFITIITGFSFSILIGFNHWEVVAGLIVSGMIIAPLSAKILSKFPVKPLMAFVGSLIVILSSVIIYKSIF